MHTIADTLPQSYVRPQLDVEGLLAAPLRVVAPFLNHRPEDRVYLEALAAQLITYVRQLPLTLPDYGLCHADLHKTNVLWDRKGHLTLIDFDSCGYSWRAYDLGVLFWSTRYLPQAGAVRTTYLKGYTEVRPLSRGAREAIPYFVAVRDLYIMSVEIGHAERGVDASVTPDDAFFDEHIHFLQEWRPAIADGRYITI